MHVLIVWTQFLRLVRKVLYGLGHLPSTALGSLGCITRVPGSSTHKEWNEIVFGRPLFIWGPLCLHGIQTDIQREGLETGKWQPRSRLEGIFILPGFFFSSSSSAKFFIPWSKYISVKFFLLVCLTCPDRVFGNVVAAEVPVGGPWSCLSNKYSLSTECLEEMFLPLYSPL